MLNNNVKLKTWETLQLQQAAVPVPTSYIMWRPHVESLASETSLSCIVKYRNES